MTIGPITQVMTHPFAGSTRVLPLRPVGDGEWLTIRPSGQELRPAAARREVPTKTARAPGEARAARDGSSDRRVLDYARRRRIAKSPAMGASAKPAGVGTM